MMESVITLTMSDGVARLRFNRPDRLNAIDLSVSRAFQEAVDRIVDDGDIRVVLLSGEGRSFVAGGDLAFLKQASDRPGAARALIGPMHEGLKRIRRAGLPIVVAAQGAVAGAGMSLVLLADFVIAAENAIFNMAYARVAATPDCGGSWALARLVGRRKAIEIALLSEPVDARTAQSLGVVNRLTPAGVLGEEAEALALRLAEAPVGAVARTIGLIDAAFTSDLETQLDRELEAFVDGAADPDFAEALDAFFERRAPRFGTRRPGAPIARPA